MMSGKYNSILFLGGESSGKSTITKLCAETFGSELVHEYGRQFYEDTPKKYELDDLVKIAAGQLELELEKRVSTAASGNPYLFIDTSLLVTYFYSMEWFGEAAPVLTAHTLPMLTSCYSYIFVCENDFEFVQDGSRQGPAFSKKQRDFYVYVLTACNIPFILLTGSPEKRLNTVTRIIGHQHDMGKN